MYATPELLGAIGMNESHVQRLSRDDFAFTAPWHNGKWVNGACHPTVSATAHRESSKSLSFQPGVASRLSTVSPRNRWSATSSPAPWRHSQVRGELALYSE